MSRCSSCAFEPYSHFKCSCFLAPLHVERVVAVQEELHPHLDFRLRFVTDTVRSPWKPPVDVVLEQTAACCLRGLIAQGLPCAKMNATCTECGHSNQFTAGTRQDSCHSMGSSQDGVWRRGDSGQIKSGSAMSALVLLHVGRS